MPTNPIDITLDSLLRVAGFAFLSSLISHWLRIPHIAFIIGAVFGVGLLGCLALSRAYAPLRPMIAYRLAQVMAGVALGVLA